MKQAMINYIKNERFDDIYTPAYAIKPLLKYIPKNITVWECCDYGKSESTRLLKEHGCKVISTDKKEDFCNKDIRQNQNVRFLRYDLGIYL